LESGQKIVLQTPMPFIKLIEHATSNERQAQICLRELGGEFLNPLRFFFKLFTDTQEHEV
jgi:hypothetical protein